MWNWISRIFKKPRKPTVNKKILLTPELIEEYYKLYETSYIPKLHHKKEIDNIIKRMLLPHNKKQYEFVADKVKMPWQLVALIHSLEASGDFKLQLHNGQRWDRKTTWVPKGLGPWSCWEEAAIDAMQRLNTKFDFETWAIPEICYALECHNGLAYRMYHSHVKSPYLWSFTNHYRKGKYVSDGKWDENAVSKQAGAMAIYKELLTFSEFQDGIRDGANNK